MMLELWNALQARYLTEDAGNKSYLTSNPIEFKMDDEEPITKQVQEIICMVQDIATVRELMTKNSQVITIIDKLPLSSEDY